MKLCTLTGYGDGMTPMECQGQVTGQGQRKRLWTSQKNIFIVGGYPLLAMLVEKGFQHEG